MPVHDDLRGFIAMLEDKGQLVRVSREVDPVLEVDVSNISEVMWALCMNTRAEQDLMISDKREQDLEHPGLSPRGEGARLGIDATRKWKEENHSCEGPDIVTMDQEVMQKVLEHWEGDGLG